jgi:putative membrane protein
MTNEKKNMSAKTKRTSITNELARERNRAAADRTLMAWIRTALAMIGFGFGVGKLYEALEQSNPDQVVDRLNSSIIVGEALIALGVLGLLAAVIQHMSILRQINNEQYIYRPPRALPMIVAALLLSIGVFAFVSILL